MSDKTRMFTGDEPPEQADAEDTGTPSPRTTIVGGRPPEDDAKVPPVPTGIQRLLRLASVDESFRQELIDRRAEVAEAAGVELTPSERAILTAIPADQLARMAGQLPEPTPDRRSFLRKTAATAVVLLGGAALSDCDSCDKSNQLVSEPAPDQPKDSNLQWAGISPDQPPPRPDHRDMDTEGGAAPDEPPPRPHVREMGEKGGAAPDDPPPRPDHNEMPTTGGAAPDEPPERPDRVPSPPGGARPDIPEPKPAPPPDGGTEDDFATPPPGWQGDEPPPRPERPRPTRGVRPDLDEEPPLRPNKPSPTRGIRPKPPKPKKED